MSNYRELTQLQNDLEPEGFTVVAFPCNQFGKEEPDPIETIREFAASQGAKFPVRDKIEVNGDDAHPLYKDMKEILPGEVKWNFAKFLIAKDGSLFRRYEPTVLPSEIRMDIETLIKQ